MSNFLQKIKAVFVRLYRKITGNWDIEIPVPAQVRTDLLYGYYSTDDAQPAQVKDHANLHWETQFQGVDGAVRHMKTMGCSTVLDVSAQLVSRTRDDAGWHSRLLPRLQAVAGLQMLFDRLRAEGVLDQVVALVVHDEPNLGDCLPGELPSAVQIVKSVTADYRELKDVKLAVIYAGLNDGEVYPNPELFDWVGLDSYKERSSILANDSYYGNLIKQLNPSQRLILVPGAYVGQDPEPFVRYANANDRVVAFLPFLWHDVSNADESFKGLGNGPEDLKAKYIQAALNMTGRNSRT